MIYRNVKGRLFRVEHSNFRLEKDLQQVVENNVDTLFGLVFLETEFVLNDFRFDTVAFDNENSSFVIIEYKRGKNESLVDQGFAYLNTVLDRKADLVLLYNRKVNANRQVSDFNWEMTRLYFVSPQFTQYQKNAIGFQQLPFRLFEIKKYADELVTVDEVFSKKVQGSFAELKEDASIKDVLKEVKVYTERDHTDKLADYMLEIYNMLRDRILELGDMIVQPTKCYIAFKKENRNVCDVEVFKKHFTVFINLPVGKLVDPFGKARDISDVGHHGNGNYSIAITSEDDIDYAINLIKQSYMYEV